MLPLLPEKGIEDTDPHQHRPGDPDLLCFSMRKHQLTASSMAAIARLAPSHAEFPFVCPERIEFRVEMKKELGIISGAPATGNDI